MTTPEETRERIKEMRQRIFDRSSNVSTKKDSTENFQKTDSNKNKAKNSQSKKVQSSEVKSIALSQDAPSEPAQQKDDKVTTVSAEIKDTGSVEKSEIGTLEIDITKTLEYTFAESNTKIKEVEDLVNESIVQASEIKETFTDRLEGLNKTLLLKINSIEKKCSSTDEKIEKELHNNSTELSKVKNSLEQNRAHLKRVFLNRSNKPKKKYQY